MKRFVDFRCNYQGLSKVKKPNSMFKKYLNVAIVSVSQHNHEVATHILKLKNSSAHLKFKNIINMKPQNIYQKNYMIEIETVITNIEFQYTSKNDQ